MVSLNHQCDVYELSTIMRQNCAFVSEQLIAVSRRVSTAHGKQASHAGISLDLVCCCFLLCAAASRDPAGARKGTTVVRTTNVLTRMMRASAACRCCLTVEKQESPAAPATLTRQTPSMKMSSGCLSAKTGQHASFLTTWKMSQTSTEVGQVRKTLYFLVGLSFTVQG